MSVKNIRGID